MRRILFAALLMSLLAAAPAAARTPSAHTPILLVTGSETGKAVDCQTAWKELDRVLVEHPPKIGDTKSKFDGGWTTLTFHHEDTRCDAPIPSDPSAGIQGQAKRLAQYIHSAYTSKGRTVDVVAHGTAGVALRYAIASSGTLGWPGKLMVEDAVTLGSPHGGSAEIADQCSRVACQQMDPEGDFVTRELAAIEDPQGEGGTDWSLIGSAKDALVPHTSAIDMPAAHRSYYVDKVGQRIKHEDLLTDTSMKRNGHLVYSHDNKEQIEWTEGPHVAARVMSSLVFGATALGGGSGNRPGCSGYNSEDDGPTAATSSGLAAWPGTAGDMSLVKVGVIEAYAECFTKVGERRFESEKVVRLNGLDITPSPGKKLAIDVEQMKITSEGATVRIPTRFSQAIPVPLRVNRPLDWTVPPTGGAVTDDGKTRFAIDGSSAIGGLRLKGGFKLTMEQGKVALEVTLALPGIFTTEAPGQPPHPIECNNGKDDDEDEEVDMADPDCQSRDDRYEDPAEKPGLTVRVATTNTSGAQLDRIAGTVPGTLKVWKLTIKQARFDFNLAENSWSAGVKAELPLPGEPSVDVDITIAEGRFKSASAQVDDLNRHVYKGVYLQRVKLATELDPFRATLGAGLSFGPKVSAGGKKVFLVRIDADLSVHDKGFTLEGPMKLAGEQLGSGKYDYNDGTLTVSATLGTEKEFHGAFGAFKAKLEGTYTAIAGDGIVDASTTTQLCLGGELVVFGKRQGLDYQCLANASGRLSLRETQLAYSTCAKLGIFGVGFKVGAAYRKRILPLGISEEFNTMAESCDVDKWHEPPAGGARAAQAATGELTLDGGRGAMIAVRGETAPPHIAVHGPDEQSLAAPAAANGIVRSGRFALIHFPGEKTTYVAIANPAAGRWRIATQPGSSPIAAIQTARVLPPARVRGRVRKVGSRRELRYRVRPIDGQRVLLVEQGRGVKRTLGAARGRGGRLRFRPAYGPGGPRRIVALVEQHGSPRTELTVARFRAEPPPRLRRPRVRLRQRGDRVAVSWAPVRGAARYVGWVRAADGSTARYDIERGRRFVVRGLLQPRRLHVEVRAMYPDGRPGPVARGRYAKRR